MDVNDYGQELRSRADGMVLAGMSHKDVAHTLNVCERSIKRWYRVHKSGATLEIKEKSGRPKFPRVAKNIIAKAFSYFGFTINDPDCNYKLSLYVIP